VLSAMALLEAPDSKSANAIAIMVLVVVFIVNPLI